MITLPHNPPVSYFIDGMDLGTAVDAITDDLAQSALDQSFTKEDIESSGASDTFYFRMVDDMTEFQSSQAFGFSNSITLPAEGLKVGAKSVFDFSSSSKSLSSMARLGAAGRREACRVRRQTQRCCQEGSLRRQGQLSQKVRRLLRLPASVYGQVHGSLEMYCRNDFEYEFVQDRYLWISEHGHKISVEVQYQVVGDAGDTQYDKGDVIKTLNSFREVVKPVPYEALLRHYSTIEGTIPITIDMEFEVYERVSKVFTLARFVLFLIGLVPGMSTVRIERKQRITALFSEIYANRIAYESDPSALKSSLEKLGAFHQELWVRLQRQELLTEICSITFEDMKSKLTVDFNNPRGSWVRSSEGVGTYVLGRTAFSGEEIMKYGIKVARDVAEVKAEGGLFKGTQTGFLRFPGGTGIRGYVVGLTIEGCWKDGTNGWWCLGNDLSLGRLEADVEVMAEDMKGMHWKLHVHYIPSAEYDK